MALIKESIPELLKQKSNWVCWGIRDAPTKSPFNPVSLLSGKPSPAKAGVRETWGDYQTALECVSRGLARGIGYEFDGGDIYGVDLDRVIDKYGALDPEAQEIVNTLCSYTEVSPSGTGLHIFVLAPGVEIERHRKKDHFIEIYNDGRYFTVTGVIYKGMKTIETRTAGVREIHDKFLLPDEGRKTQDVSPAVPVKTDHERFLSIGLGRDKVFAALWAGERRCGNESSDDIALMNKLSYWLSADPDAMVRAFLSSPYHAQKDEAHKNKCRRPDYLYNTAKNACATVYSTAAVDHERWQDRKRERGYAR